MAGAASGIGRAVVWRLASRSFDAPDGQVPSLPDPTRGPRPVI